MEGKRFVETERTYRLSPDLVRHGLDQCSSLSVHNHRSLNCANTTNYLVVASFCRAAISNGQVPCKPVSTRFLSGVIVVPNSVLHQDRTATCCKCRKGATGFVTLRLQ